MNPVYYCIALDEPGSPGFYTFAKNYLGTVFDIDHVLGRMAQIGRYPDAVQAFTAFKDRGAEAAHTVCFHKEKLMNPCTFGFIVYLNFHIPVIEFLS